MAYWRNVLVIAWGSAGTPSLIEEQRKVMTRVLVQHARMSLVHITFGAIPLPGPQARAAFSALDADFGARIDYTAVLVGEGGFWASAVRSVMTSFLLSKRNPKMNLCGSIAETSRWVAQGHYVRPNERVDAAELRQALEWVLDLPELRPFRHKVS